MRKGQKASQQNKDNMSRAQKARFQRPEEIKKKKEIMSSPEVRAKISKALKGKVSPNKGKPMTEEQKIKISCALKGQIIPPEARAKMSVARKEYMKDPEVRKHLSILHTGMHQSPETCAKISKAVSERMKNPEIRAKLSVAFSGAGNPRWLGGISFEPYCPKFNDDLKRRVRAYFDGQCLICGKTTKENGEELCVHHVEYNKMACCDGKLVQFAALCRKCHMKTNNSRESWEEILHRVIDEIYGGRSYFTKEEYDSQNCGKNLETMLKERQ